MRGAALAAAASALAAAAAVTADPAPAEDWDTESDGTFSDIPDYICPNCGAGLFGAIFSHEEFIALLCGCTGPPGPK